MNNILNKDQIVDLKKSGKLLAEALKVTTDAVVQGISTLKLDEIAEKALRDRGLRPSFKHYFVAGAGEFPSSICISVNEEIVHGIPGGRTLKDGDIVSIDIGGEYHGVCTDMAVTVPVGEISVEARKLIGVTEKSLELGVAQAKAGSHIGDIGHAVQVYAEANDLGVIRDFVGHGIGLKPHLPPQIPNFGDIGDGEEIVEGMALAIEPMLALGDYDVTVSKNRWTVSTTDRSLAAHFEHTLIVEDGKPVIVTKC